VSRILVVEDEAHLAKGLCFNLQAEGYSAEVVGDGETATDRLLGKKENFDAIVLDIMLPGKDGFSVVSELRAARNYVPVLMLTARSRPEDVLKGFAAGADDYLPKPFDLSILLARLQGLLRRSQWMRSGQGAANPDSPSNGSQPASDPRNVSDFGTFSFRGCALPASRKTYRSWDSILWHRPARPARNRIRVGDKNLGKQAVLRPAFHRLTQIHARIANLQFTVHHFSVGHG
jgi:DNA-binding response OmpR family regulator